MVVAGLDAHLEDDLRYSEQLDLDQWRRRNLGQRLFENVTTLARPWM